MSTRDIARQFGVRPNTVTDKRRNSHPETLDHSRINKIHWETVDWTKSNSEIASTLDCHEHTVSKKRCALFGCVKPSFDGVDWSKQNNVAIALQTGASLGYVSQIRGILAPDTVDNANSHKGGDWNSVDWSKSNIEIPKDMGVSPSAVSSQRRTMALDTLKQKKSMYDWNNVDWTMTNEKIAETMLKDRFPDNEIDPYSLLSLTKRVIERRRQRTCRMRNEQHLSDDDNTRI